MEMMILAKKRTVNHKIPNDLLKIPRIFRAFCFYNIIELQS
jgi:hypothetical protein